MGRIMANSEFEGVPFQLRVRGYTQLMAGGWAAWIELMVDAVIGENYPQNRHYDVMLTALAIGAARWARDPSAKPPRNPTFTQTLKRWQALQDEGRDSIDDDVVRMLSRSVQSACKEIGAHLAFEDDIRVMMIPLQLSALRAGAAQAMSHEYPADTTLATLDTLLREHLPADVTWWESAPLI